MKSTPSKDCSLEQSDRVAYIVDCFICERNVILLFIFYICIIVLRTILQDLIYDLSSQSNEITVSLPRPTRPIASFERAYIMWL